MAEKRETDSLNHNYSNVIHNEPYTPATALNLRKITENNDPASIGNRAKIYNEMSNDNNYKVKFVI
jgi:hypothetical protein